MKKYTEKQLIKDAKRLQKKAKKRGIPYSVEELLLIHKRRWISGGLFLIGLEILVIVLIYLLFFR